ncbi:Potassium channel KAT3 [Zea mays]|uniref:Potassium channel KAT3 n=2 Tax=Zea mays TaxID=4577 RepID=A0A1D6G3D0_MAIZE|nr:Potassium channel KAT3 [Zea mays]
MARMPGADQAESWALPSIGRRGGGVSGDLLPAFGELSPTGGNSNTINPYDCRYRWWQGFLIGPVLYSAWSSPFELALDRAATTPVVVASLVMDAFFAADIAVSFFVAYFDRSANLFVDDRRKIATRYLKRPSFAMDVASTIPFNVIYQLVSGRSTGWFRYLNLLRLWRLQRVSKLFARLEKDIRFDYFYTRLIKLCGVTLLALHSSACIFLWMAFQVPPRRQGAHLARQPGARLRGRQRLGQLHLRRVLVHHHARHRRVRRPARREPRRDGVRHLLHALQHQPHLLHHRQHHQPRRPRRNQHIQDEGHGAAGLDVRERQPAAAGAEGADDGERAAQVQHSGGDPAAAAVRPAHGAPVPGRAPPLQGRGPALLPVSGSLQRPRRAAGFGDEGRVFPTPGGHHPPEGDHHRLLHHRLRLSGRVDNS